MGSGGRRGADVARAGPAGPVWVWAEGWPARASRAWPARASRAKDRIARAEPNARAAAGFNSMVGVAMGRLPSPRAAAKKGRSREGLKASYFVLWSG